MSNIEDQLMYIIQNFNVKDNPGEISVAYQALKQLDEASYFKRYLPGLSGGEEFILQQRGYETEEYDTDDE